jgi:hypothetical protein
MLPLVAEAGIVPEGVGVPVLCEADAFCPVTRVAVSGTSKTAYPMNTVFSGSSVTVMETGLPPTGALHRRASMSAPVLVVIEVHVRPTLSVMVKVPPAVPWQPAKTYRVALARGVNEAVVSDATVPEVVPEVKPLGVATSHPLPD